MFNFFKKKQPTLMGFPVTASKKPPCVCITLPANPTSQDYNNRYLSILKCPIHSKVPDKETKRYELKPDQRFPSLDNQKGFMRKGLYAVMQAVNMGRDGSQTGIKGIDSAQGWRFASIFSTREDARAYLLDVLDTVKKEQKMGIRSKRNLDPSYIGGLDFCIIPTFVFIPKAPLLARKWVLPKLSTDKTRRLTQTDVSYKHTKKKKRSK